jgi:Flp pilus assembly protein TadG
VSRRPLTCRRRDDRGSAQVELVILAVVSFLFVAMIVFAGRLNVGSAHAEAAARSAARTISVARNPELAVPDARADAERTVEVGSAMCQSMGFEYGISADEVTVTIDCEVDLSEATLLEVPGSMSVTATASEVIDQYREADDGGAAVAP